MSLNDILDDASRRMAIVPDEMCSPETQAMRSRLDPLAWTNEKIAALDWHIASFRARRRKLVKRRRQLQRKR